MVARNLGKMGENTLSFWCSQVGIIENKSDEDMAGWDHLLEFPLPLVDKTRQIPLDKDPFPLRCFLQVKASDDSPGERQVKLDNWLRLVKNPLPCFFLFLEFDKKDTCQRAFLVHVDKSYITQVLKRLRQVKPEVTDKLHKMSMIFKYTEADELSSLDGKGLSEAIRKHVLVSPEDYATQKIEIVRTAGYDEGYWTINFTILAPPDSGTDAQEILVDFLIGLTPHLNVQKAVLNAFRFGVLPPETKQIAGEGAKLGVERKSVGNGLIRMRTSDTHEEIRINTEVYAPQGINIEIPGQYFKVRFAAPFIDFFVWPKHRDYCTFQFGVPAVTSTHRLRDLQPISQLLLFLHKALTNQSTVSVDISFNSLPLAEASMKANNLIDDLTNRFMQTMRNAWIIARYFDLDQNIEVVPLELLKQETAISVIAGAIERHEANYEVGFLLPSTPPDEGLLYCIPWIRRAVIGTQRLVVALALIGQKIEPTGEMGEGGTQFKLSTTEVRICRKYIYDAEEDSRYTKENLIQIVSEEYQDKMQVIIINNI